MGRGDQMRHSLTSFYSNNAVPVPEVLITFNPEGVALVYLK